MLARSSRINIYKRPRRSARASQITIPTVRHYKLVVPESSPSGAMAINLFNQLAEDPYYSNIASTFDSFILRGVHIVITGVSQILLALMNGRPTAYISYSRTGLPYNTYKVTARFVASQSSSHSVKWGMFKLCEFDIFPFSLNERSQWLPTFSMAYQGSGSDFTLNNPRDLASTTVIPFKPTLLFGVQTGYTASGAQTFVFECRANYTIEPRGMRVPSLISPSPNPPLPPVPPVSQPISLSKFSVDDGIFSDSDPVFYDFSLFEAVSESLVFTIPEKSFLFYIKLQTDQTYSFRCEVRERGDPPEALQLDSPAFYLVREIPNGFASPKDKRYQIRLYSGEDPVINFHTESGIDSTGAGDVSLFSAFFSFLW